MTSLRDTIHIYPWDTQILRKMKLLLALPLVLVFLAFTVALPSADQSLKNPKLRAMIQRLEPANVVSRGVFKSDGDVDSWSECVNIPVLDETCISITVFPDNLTLILTLVVHNYTIINTELTGTSLCLDQADLLKLLELIPALIPFKSFIDGIIKLLHFIPAQIFSVCVDINNLNVTSTAATGCVTLNSTLICWKDKCVYQGTDNFGCFDIPLDHLPAANTNTNTNAEEASNTESGFVKQAPIVEAIAMGTHLKRFAEHIKVAEAQNKS